MSIGLDYASYYIHRGWLPHPLHPGEKTPARKFKHLVDGEPPFDQRKIMHPWEFGTYDVGILLKPSGLLVIDCDNEAAVEEAIGLTPEPCNNIVRTRRGLHLYYRRSEGCPPLRTVRRGLCGKIDVLADGYVVAPASTNGPDFTYEWVRTGELQEAPGWAVGLLKAIRERSIQTNGCLTPESVLSAPDLDMDALAAHNHKVWRFMTQEHATDDRSGALWLTITTLMRFHLVPILKPLYPHLQYSDESIVKAVWFAKGSIKEKPHQRGFQWLCDEIARARLEPLPA